MTEVIVKPKVEGVNSQQQLKVTETSAAYACSITTTVAATAAALVNDDDAQPRVRCR